MKFWVFQLFARQFIFKQSLLNLKWSSQERKLCSRSRISSDKMDLSKNFGWSAVNFLFHILVLLIKLQNATEDDSMLFKEMTSSCINILRRISSSTKRLSMITFWWSCPTWHNTFQSVSPNWILSSKPHSTGTWSTASQCNRLCLGPSPPCPRWRSDSGRPRGPTCLSRVSEASSGKWAELEEETFRTDPYF